MLATQLPNVLEPHQYCLLFPPLSEEELALLVKDIGENGLRSKITLFEGMILDGRNRYDACKMAGIDMQFEEFAGTNEQALALVLSKNLHRRHLTEGQKGIIAAELATLAKGKPVNSGIPLFRQDQAAKVLGTSLDSVKKGRQIRSKGTPALNMLVKNGAVSLAAGAAVATLPPEEQDRVANHGPGEVKKVAADIRRTSTHVEKALGFRPPAKALSAAAPLSATTSDWIPGTTTEFMRRLDSLKDTDLTFLQEFLELLQYCIRRLDSAKKLGAEGVSLTLKSGYIGAQMQSPKRPT
jgi:ParB-like chromosome segregation protein Spo0J